MSVKERLLKIYTWSMLSKEQANGNQQTIRNMEWEAIKPYMRKGDFLDVGCGAGYAMKKASQDFSCTTYGIDPEPYGHGVGRIGSGHEEHIDNIQQAFAENIPFADKKFDIVYSSHVLEHVANKETSLSEMRRVMKDDGVLIIGMPTATMASINWLSQTLFTTHIKLVNFFLRGVITTGKTSFRSIFIPDSHSVPEDSLLRDLKEYKVTSWQSLIEKFFVVEKVLLPALYPYPEFLQFFPVVKDSQFSSSVFFICHKPDTGNIK